MCCLFAVYLRICTASIIGSSTASEIKQKHSLDDAQSESDAQIENIFFFILVIIMDNKYKIYIYILKIEIIIKFELDLLI